MKVTRPFFTWASMFSSLPLVRSSTTCTRAPRASKASTRCDPIKDAPPVTSTFLRSQMASPIPLGCRFFHNFGEALEFIHCSIFSCGFPGAAAHFSETCGIAAQLANCGGHGCGIVRIGREPASGFNDNARRIARRSSHSEYRTPRRENRIELAWNHHALESPAHGDDMQIAGHHHVRYLLDGPERQKANVRRIRRGCFQRSAVCSTPYEHQTCVFVAENLRGF